MIKLQVTRWNPACLIMMKLEVFHGVADGPHLAKLIHAPWCTSTWILLLKMPVGQPAAISVGGLGVIFQQPNNQWIGNSEKRKRQFYFVEYTSWTHDCLWLKLYSHQSSNMFKSCLVKHGFKLSSHQIVCNDVLSTSNLVHINACNLKLTRVFCFFGLIFFC